MAMWKFAERLWRGEPIQVYNHGNMKRDFTFIDDIVDGLCCAIGATGLDAYELFNLGNSRSEKLLDMVAEVEKAFGTKARLEMLPMQPGDIPSSHADIALSQQKLGFNPATPISVGIPKFVAWFKEYHGL